MPLTISVGTRGYNMYVYHGCTVDAIWYYFFGAKVIFSHENNLEKKKAIRVREKSTFGVRCGL